MKRLPFWQKKYLINPKFQLSFIGYNVVTAAIVGVIVFVSGRYFFWKVASSGVKAGLPKDHIFFQFLAEQTRLMNTVFAFTFLLIVAVLAIRGLMLSHRVAGPLNRFRRHMVRLAQGEELEPIRFRSKDYFQELVEAFNGQSGQRTQEGAPASEEPAAEVRKIKPAKRNRNDDDSGNESSDEGGGKDDGGFEQVA